MAGDALLVHHFVLLQQGLGREVVPAGFAQERLGVQVGGRHVGVQVLLPLEPLAARLADVGHVALPVLQLHVSPQRRPRREGQAADRALEDGLELAVDGLHVAGELLATGEALQAHGAQELRPVLQLDVVLQPLLRLRLEPALAALEVQGRVAGLPALPPSLALFAGLLLRGRGGGSGDVLARGQGGLLAAVAGVEVFELHVHDQPLPAVVQPATVRALQRLLGLVAFQGRPPALPR